MKKDIKIVEEHWDCFAIWNDNGDPTLEFDCVFELQLISGDPEVRYLSNGDPGYPATADEIEILDVEINSASIVTALGNSDCFLTDESQKAFETMLLNYVRENNHSIEWKSWEDFR